MDADKGAAAMQRFFAYLRQLKADFTLYGMSVVLEYEALYRPKDI